MLHDLTVACCTCALNALGGQHRRQEFLQEHTIDQRSAPIQQVHRQSSDRPVRPTRHTSRHQTRWCATPLHTGTHRRGRTSHGKQWSGTAVATAEEAHSVHMIRAENPSFGEMFLSQPVGQSPAHMPGNLPPRTQSKLSPNRILHSQGNCEPHPDMSSDKCKRIWINA